MEEDTTSFRYRGLKILCFYWLGLIIIINNTAYKLKKYIHYGRKKFIYLATSS